jgi:hypothetical protein
MHVHQPEAACDCDPRHAGPPAAPPHGVVDAHTPAALTKAMKRIQGLLCP